MKKCSLIILMVLSFNVYSDVKLKADVLNFVDNKFKGSEKTDGADWEDEADFDFDPNLESEMELEIENIEDILMPNFNVDKEFDYNFDIEDVVSSIEEEESRQLDNQFNFIKKIPISNTKFSEVIKSKIGAELMLVVKYKKPLKTIVTFEKFALHTFPKDKVLTKELIEIRIKEIKEFNKIKQKETFLPNKTIYVPYNILEI